MAQKMSATYARKRGFLGRDPLEEAVGRFGRAVPAAGEVAGMIEGGFQPAAGTYGALEQPVAAGIRKLIEQPLSPQRYAEGYGRVTRGFGARAGRYATGQAKRGFVSKGGVETNISGVPSAALAAGLGQYQVGWEREQARQLEAGLGAAGTFREDIARPRAGYGAFVGEFARPQYGQRRSNLSWDYNVGRSGPYRSF